MAKQPLEESPQFDNPPVIEVVCGVLFEPLELQAPHFGLFWQKIDSDYSSFESVAPIMPNIEHFDADIPTSIELDNNPLPRIWFKHRNGDSLIQVQKDRFLFNWKKASIEGSYPRYHRVFDGFNNTFSKFSQFVEESGLGALRHRQYELTYVNHIDIGSGWDQFAEIGKVMPDFSWQRTESRFLPDPEAFNWKTTFRLPGKTGRLHVLARTARKTSNHPAQVLRLDITARGFPDSGSDQRMHEWFEIAHRWIVKGFVDLTSETFQKQIWQARFL